MYIPDLTERFPEGFGGVDMTDSFFLDDSYDYDCSDFDDWDDEYYEDEED